MGQLNKGLSILVLLWCLLWNTAVIGQPVDSSVDSLTTLVALERSDTIKIDLLIELSKKYQNQQQFSKAEEYAKKSLELSQKINNRKRIIQSQTTLILLYRNSHNLWKAIESGHELLNFYEQQGELEAYWVTKFRLAMIYYEMGDYQNSLNWLFSALEYFEKQDNTQWIATICNNIGIIFHRGRNDIEKSLQYYQRGYDIIKSERVKDNELHIFILTNIGLAKYGNGYFEEAEWYFMQSLKVNEQLNDKHVESVNYGNLGLVYNGLNDYKKAQEYFEKAIALSIENKNELSTAINTADLAALHIKEAKTHTNRSVRNPLIYDAISKYNTAIEVFKRLKDFRRFGNYSKELSEAYELLGDYPKALLTYKDYAYYNDSLFNDETSKEFSRLEIQHEFNKREDSIRLENEKRIAVKDAVLQAHKKQKRLLMVGVLLLIVIGLLLFHQNIVRKHTNIKLSKLNEELNEANQSKVKFLSILNHDLRSPISNIIKFMRHQQHSSDEMDIETKSRLQNQVLDGTENLLTSMDDMLLWCKGQMENFEPQFKPVSVESIFEKLKGLVSDMSAVHISYKNLENLTITTDENYLKTIVRNLTYNAIKALAQVDNPKIAWEAYTRNESQVLSIQDNGIGSDSEQFRALYDDKYTVGIKTGLGLHLIRDMAKAINCRIEVLSTPNVGTTILLIF